MLGDVIIPTSGESPEEISTCTCVMQDGVILAGDLNIYRTNDLDGRFLSYEINHVRNREIAKIAQGKSIVHIKADELAKIVIRFPSKAEQSKIIELFSCLDRKIELQKELIESLKLYKRGLLSKLFPQKRNDEPQYRFTEFKDAWEQRKLGEIVSICSGKDYKHLDEGDIPVYGTGGYMLSVSDALSNDSDAIGIGRKGTIDKPYILKSPFWTVDTLFYCIPHEKNDLDFVFGTFQNIDWKAMDESTGVPSLSKTAINSVDVLTPSFEEQEKIGCYFSHLDHLITLHHSELENFETIKSGLLQKLFI